MVNLRHIVCLKFALKIVKMPFLKIIEYPICTINNEFILLMIDKKPKTKHCTWVKNIMGSSVIWYHLSILV